MANDKSDKVPAPNALRCEAGGNSCGAGQPLFTAKGLVFCDHHADWPNSKEGRVEIAMREAQKAG